MRGVKGDGVTEDVVRREGVKGEEVRGDEVKGEGAKGETMKKRESKPNKEAKRKSIFKFFDSGGEGRRRTESERKPSADDHKGSKSSERKRAKTNDGIADKDDERERVIDEKEKEEEGEGGGEGGETKLEDEELLEVWSGLLRTWEESSKKNQKQIKALARRGIPAHMRAMAWQLLSGAHVSELKDAYPALINVSAASTDVHTHTHTLSFAHSRSHCHTRTLS